MAVPTKNKSVTSKFETMNSTQGLRGLCLIGLLVIATAIIYPFWTSVVWAGLIAIIFWPAYEKLGCQCHRFPNLKAGFFTLSLISVLSIPIAWGISEAQQELPTLSEIGGHLEPETLAVPEWLERLPLLGTGLSGLLHALKTEASNQSELIRSLLSPAIMKLTKTLQHVPQNTAGILLTVISLFFFFRDGQILGTQFQMGMHRIAGSSTNTLISNITSTTRAVAIGIFGSALVQGIMASTGFWIFGFKTPLLLGLLTCVASLVPVFGTALIWGPIALWLVLEQGDLKAGVGLIAWGGLVINPVDNLLRPLVISYGAHHPLLLIILGVLGGLFSLGPIGIFIGPLTLTLLARIWLQWIEREDKET